MSRMLPLVGASPRRALVGLFFGFATIATILVVLESTTARAIVAICGLAALFALAWLVLQRQFDQMFNVLTRVDQDGLPLPLTAEEMPKFAPLAAAVAAREDRGNELRTVLDELRATSERLALTLDVATQGLYEIHFEPGNASLDKGRYFVSGMKFFDVPADRLEEWDIESINRMVLPAHRGSYQKAALTRGHLDEVYDATVRAQDRDGNWRWIWLRGRTLERVGGDPVRSLAVLTDITQRKELEDRAAHSDTMRSLGHLVAGLTHDLNNILAVIRANADLMVSFDVSKVDADRLAQGTRDMADDGFALLNGLLGLTPPSDKASVIELDRLVDHIAEALRELAPPAVRIEAQYEADETLVRVDRARLDQVVLNLGLNALHSIDGVGRIKFRARSVALDSNNRHGLPSGEYVMLDVSDDGGGIDPSILDTMFEPFVTTKQAGMGTGLGLATSFDTVSHA
ncbi:MAG: PAS domain S-box protein, partial [Acidimicrobiales bacterium]|nr:PAS domain S-box protein [Acidimicrobiales bacterium]